MDWLTEHGSSILEWIGGVVSCASIIVKLTPTVKDDGIVSKLVQLVSYLSIFNTKKDEAKLSK